MLYGKKEVQSEILKEVHRFEKKRNITVIFGAIVGSISKGMGRVDSDYDTRFLYIENDNILLEKLVAENVCEKDVHLCSYPEKENLFYDKIAYWELTSFLNYLITPVLDKKESYGLYHIVNWTFRSPFVWDPYGMVGKISPFLDELFEMKYEVDYYMRYINRCFGREQLLLREYLYSAYYFLSIQWCIERKVFAPVYFPTLLRFCEDNELVNAINALEKQYFNSAIDLVNNTDSIERKMANNIVAERNLVVDHFIEKSYEYVMQHEKEVALCEDEKKYKEKRNIYNNIIEIVKRSMNDNTIKDVND